MQSWSRLSVAMEEWTWEDVFACVAEPWSAKDILGTPVREAGSWSGEIQPTKGCKHLRVLSTHGWPGSSVRRVFVRGLTIF